MKKIFALAITLFWQISFAQNNSDDDPHFEPIYTSEPVKIFTLSLDSFVLKYGANFMWGINSCIKDANFKKINFEGKKKIKIFKIIQPASSQNCLDFMKAHNGILPSAYGLAIAFIQIRPHLMYNNLAILGFDERSNFNENSCGVPLLKYSLKYPPGWYFDYGFWDGNWLGQYFLFFSD